MGLTITKTSAGRMKIDDSVKQTYHSISGILTMKSDVDDVILEMSNGGEKLKSMRTNLKNIVSPVGTTPSIAIGDCTFDETGGTVDDEWTKTDHGLFIDDSVMFTTVGTGATGYAVDTRYFVVGLPDVDDTFTLSATLGGAVIAGTGDSVGTWTLEQLTAQDVLDAIEAVLTL